MFNIWIQQLIGKKIWWEKRVKISVLSCFRSDYTPCLLSRISYLLHNCNDTQRLWIMFLFLRSPLSSVFKAGPLGVKVVNYSFQIIFSSYWCTKINHSFQLNEVRCFSSSGMLPFNLIFPFSLAYLLTSNKLLLEVTTTCFFAHVVDPGVCKSWVKMRW